MPPLLTPKRPTLLVNLRTFAGLMRVPEQIVRDSVRRGYLDPAARGRIGRGGTHRFALWQCLGFALATAYRNHLNCGARTFKQCIDCFRTMDDEQVWQWSEAWARSGPRDPHDEELAAQLHARRPMHGCRPIVIPEDQQKAWCEWGDTVLRVFAWMKEQQGQGQGRFIRQGD
jgi:hypothetical protein